MSQIFVTIKEVLGKYACADKIPDMDDLLIEMYHECTRETSKKKKMNS